MSEQDLRKLKREFLVSLLASVVIMLFSVIFAFGQKSNQIEDNTKAIETLEEREGKRLDRIEDKVDKIYELMID